MKVPIPQDWDGETWKCVQVYWPDSPQWLAILAGLLSYPMLGRFWDERTGSILTVQITGKEIWERNQPFNSCQGEIEETPGQGTTGGPCFAPFDDCDFEESEETMSTGPCPPIKVENGILYWWQCCEWLEVGSIAPADTAPDLPDDLWENDELPAPTYYPCGQANAVLDAIWEVASQMWDEGDESPFGWIGDVQGVLPGFDLSDQYTFNGIMEGEVLRALSYGEEEVFDLVTKQAVLCRLEKLFTDSPGTLTDEQYNNIKGCFTSEMGGEQGIFDWARRAIGKKNLSNIAKMGATDSTADCECPGEGLLSSVRWGTPTISSIPAGDTVTYETDLYGKRIEFTWNIGSTEDVFRDIVLTIPLIVPGAGAQILIKHEKTQGSAMTEEWSDGPCPDSDPTAWMQGKVEGPGPGDWTLAITDGGGWSSLEYTYAGGEVPTQWSESSVRLCPRTSLNTTRKFRLTILEWDNTPI